MGQPGSLLKRDLIHNISRVQSLHLSLKLLVLLGPITYEYIPLDVSIYV